MSSVAYRILKASQKYLVFCPVLQRGGLGHFQTAMQNKAGLHQTLNINISSTSLAAVWKSAETEGRLLNSYFQTGQICTVSISGGWGTDNIKHTSDVCLVWFLFQLVELLERCYTNLYDRAPTQSVLYTEQLLCCFDPPEKSDYRKGRNVAGRKSSESGLNLAEIPAYFNRHLLHSFRLLRNVSSSNAVSHVSCSVSILEANTGPVLCGFLPTALFFSSQRKEVCESWAEF